MEALPTRWRRFSMARRRSADRAGRRLDGRRGRAAFRAAASGSALSRLLLVATGGFTADRGRRAREGRRDWSGALERGDRHADRRWVLLQAAAATKLAEYRGIALSRVASRRRSRPPVRTRTSRTLDDLGRIRVPTLIIQGRHDRARTPEHGAEMRDRIAGTRARGPRGRRAHAATRAAGRVSRHRPAVLLGVGTTRHNLTIARNRPRIDGDRCMQFEISRTRHAW